MQGSTADLVGLVDLSASAHQGHSALVPPVSSRVVQWCPVTTKGNTGDGRSASGPWKSKEKVPKRHPDGMNRNSPSHDVPLVQISTTT